MNNEKELKLTGDNLKPCPLCGGEAKLHHYGNPPDDVFYVSCNKCGITTQKEINKSGSCPFCGSEATFRPVIEYTADEHGHGIGWLFYIVSCPACKVCTKFYRFKTDAINAWNIRADNDN